MNSLSISSVQAGSWDHLASVFQAWDESLHPHLLLCLSCSLWDPASPCNEAFSPELWAAEVAPGSGVHSRINGGREGGGSWPHGLLHEPLVGLTTEAGAPPWGLKLGTACPLCNLGSHGPRPSPVARPPQLAAESRSPGFAQAPRSGLSHRRMNCRILL